MLYFLANFNDSIHLMLILREGKIMNSKLLLHLIAQYGYAGLFGILAISILGIPLPDEFILTFVGFLTYIGHFNLVFAVIAAASGSAVGITAAYLAGRFFHERVARELKQHAGGQRVEKVLTWYQTYGGKLLTIGYFIPGVRHVSGYIAGLSRLSYRKFAFFAYLGATIWTAAFIVLGRLLGSRWDMLLPIIHRYALRLGIAAVIVVVVFLVIHKRIYLKEEGR